MTVNMLQLSESQQEALDVFNSGESMLLTGAAGTGKTVLIKEMVACAKDKGLKVQVCATTGCAADPRSGRRASCTTDCSTACSAGCAAGYITQAFR